MGQGNLDDFSAQLLVLLHSLHDFGLNLGVNALAKIFLGQANAQALHVGAQRLSEVGHSHIQRGGVHFIFTADGVQYQRSVGYVTGDRSDLVQGGSEGYAAITGYTAIGGLNANAAVEGSRLTNGAAGIGAQSPNSFASSNRSSAAAGGATGNALQIPRVMGRTIVGGFGGGAHGEFVHIGLAEENGFVSTQIFNNMGIINRHYIAQHFRRASSE